MLLEMLPLLKGWEDYAFDQDNPITIPPNSTHKIVQATSPGWLYAFSITVTGSNDVTFLLKWYEPKSGTWKTASIKPYDLVSMGLDMPNDSGPWVSNWDTTTGTYTVLFTPATPLPFFASDAKPRHILVKTKDEPVVVLGYSQEAFVIYDKELFMKSLRELMKTGLSIKVEPEFRLEGLEGVE